jgi:hypothetical protein
MESEMEMWRQLQEKGGKPVHSIAEILNLLTKKETPSTAEMEKGEKAVSEKMGEKKSHGKNFWAGKIF